MSSSDIKSVKVRAFYKSLIDSKQFNYNISESSGESNVDPKVLHLAQLRSVSKKMQDEINVFLTKKMDLEKKQIQCLSTDKATHGESKSGEEMNEQNYGEEEMDDAEG